MTAADYRDQIKALLPPGLAYQFEQDGAMAGLIAAMADEMARVDAAGLLLVEESDPRTTSAMFQDWEYDYGLPDLCDNSVPSMVERRQLLLAKIMGIGGQSPSYFIELAAIFGYTITITEFHPFRVDESDVDDALYGDEWAYAWQVNAPVDVITEFTVDESAVGDALREWGDTRLECVIGRAKPAHTNVIFAYS